MNRERWGLVAILVLFAAIYARTAEFAFVWDDVEAIVENPIYAGQWRDGLSATQHDHLDPAYRKLSGIKPSHDSYRPLLYLSYRADVALFGMSPRAMHVHNLLLAMLAVLAFYLVALDWLGSRATALLATGIFALHPLQVETVAYISGRGDLLAGLFALIAVASSFQLERTEPSRALQRGAWLVAGVACFAASVLSKEAYIGLPLALFGIGYARGTLREQLPVIGAWTGALIAYLTLRFAMAGTAGSGTGIEAFVALPGVFLRYVEMALLPFDLSTERLYDARYVAPGWIAASIAALWLLTELRRGSSVTSRTVVSGIWWMCVLLGPSVVVIVLMGVVADRYAYLPLGGFAIATSALARSLLRSRSNLRPIGLSVGALWAVACLATTAMQVDVWKSNSALYANAVRAAPESSMAHYRLGHQHAKAGRWSEATAHFQRALELDPSNHRAHNNLGVAYLESGRYAEAAASFQRALAETGHTHFRAWYNLGVAQGHMGQMDDACAAVERALQINPIYEEAAAFRRDYCDGRP